MVGNDLALAVSPKEVRVAPGGRGRKKFRVAAVDYGMKRNIVRLLQAGSCRVEIFPATATDAEILSSRPDGIFLSNGPGDPAALTGQSAPQRRCRGGPHATDSECDMPRG